MVRFVGHHGTHITHITHITHSKTELEDAAKSPYVGMHCHNRFITYANENGKVTYVSRDDIKNTVRCLLGDLFRITFAEGRVCRGSWGGS